jgi:hypothetical protein
MRAWWYDNVLVLPVSLLLANCCAEHLFACLSVWYFACLCCLLTVVQTMLVCMSQRQVKRPDRIGAGSPGMASSEGQLGSEPRVPVNL